MVEQRVPPEPHSAAPTYVELEDLELFRRSPHPYLRHKDEIWMDTPDSSQPPSQTPQSSPLHPSEHMTSEEEGRKRRTSASQSPSESGSEADDEGYNLVKALPAPPLRLHKGLRDPQGPEAEGSATPLLTPTQIDDQGRKLSEEYFENGKTGLRSGKASFMDEEARVARQKYRKRRRMELIRRTTETAELAAIGLLTLHGCSCRSRLWEWHRELLTQAFVMGGLLALYPVRILYHSWRCKSKLSLQRRIHVPAAFDPATILYPPLVPVLISISLFDSNPRLLLPNIILGLSALPARLIPFRRATVGYSTLHWLLSILPLVAAENTDFPSAFLAPKPYKLRLSSPDDGLDPSLLVLLFPLHQALLPPLYYLTTTSLLPAELHLLSIALINLLLFSESPQASILKILLWMGGLGLFILCGRVLKWGVALARIPRWRLRRAGQVVRARTSFLQTLNESLGKRTGRASREMSDSDADEDEPALQTKLQKTNSLKLGLINSVRKPGCVGSGNEPQSAVEAKKSGFEPANGWADGTFGRKRSHTLPMPVAQDHNSRHGHVPRKRSKSLAQSYLSLTPAQATLRKWLYAGYFYVVVALLILGPIRYTIGEYALHSHEPFGWAISYLFGNIQRLRWQIFNWNLGAWIPLPPLADANNTLPLPPLESLRHSLGLATTRLLVSAYYLLTILLGLTTVLSLTPYTEVDTRRKVFHGTMVAMLLPTVFIDPCFVSLALALVLALFLVLDILRASQLPPLAGPIATFLTPYVDGRDLRGPVVVSPIFLLIGCAVPLWLSLAGVERAGEAPWAGWEVGAHEREMGMVAGVVCVGLGDAAASLVGRRWGRRRWVWVGGCAVCAWGESK
ncbi:similar to phosphatidate cytidylyltransferase [Plenodomus lingam JN3]|uniref:dolichol kinase n=1 Tax=Leptosphaeria maculans (strain JN3 / isolate v23.1.3 / race Av1-4-5-6-7-8) TaxID=985895 RepID=E4ZFT3_LEPMJ|nr:similar to phosphatidate cytidylyltransferase [Plenodomus lingam JN3]CBX90153.1 similar to phosphatidate cytidylyltransferase [Plenodomus lingam JN3]